jgi:hypothetical protein
MHKGGYINFKVTNNRVRYDFYAGDQSSNYGQRAPQYPIEIDLKVDGKFVGQKCVVYSMSDVWAIADKYNDPMMVAGCR